MKKLTQLTGAPNKCNSIKKWIFKREVVGAPASVPSMAGGEEKGYGNRMGNCLGKGEQGEELGMRDHNRELNMLKVHS